MIESKNLFFYVLYIKKFLSLCLFLFWVCFVLENIYNFLRERNWKIFSLEHYLIWSFLIKSQTIYWHIARNVSPVFGLSLTHSICFDQTSQHQPMRGWDSRHRPITALDYSEQSSRVECSKTLVLLLSLCVWEQASSSSNLACGCAGWADCLL